MSKLSLPEGFSEVDLDALRQHLKCENPITNEFLKIALQNAILFDRKQSDYGPRNISKFQSYGCIVRMNDKVERISNLMGQKRRKPRNESVEDSLRDISNYAVIALMCENGQWPK